MIPVLVGIILLVFHNRLAKGIAEYQNRQFGFHFGEGIVRLNRIISIFVGILFLTVGALALVDVIPGFE